MNKPKFPLGQVLATPGALGPGGKRSVAWLSSSTAISNGDWGEVGDEDKRANDQALVDGSRILSAYRTSKGERLWIITEAADDEGKRAATTILKPSEY